jgi:hypothetical protein
LAIFDISPDEIIFGIDDLDKEESYQIPANIYFDYIKFLFNLPNLSNDSNNNSNPNNNSIIKFIKKVFGIYEKTPYYKNLKDKINKFFTHFNIGQTNKTIGQLIKENISKSNFKYQQGYPFTTTNNNSYNFIDELDKISSSIMELYSLILILLLDNPNVIYYAGYYHSNNIAYILQKYYGFVQLYSKGKTDDLHDPDNISSCIIVNKSIFFP